MVNILQLFYLKTKIYSSKGLLYTGLKNGSIIEFDPVTKKSRVIYSSLSVDDHRLNCGK